MLSKAMNKIIRYDDSMMFLHIIIFETDKDNDIFFSIIIIIFYLNNPFLVDNNIYFLSDFIIQGCIDPLNPNGCVKNTCVICTRQV